MDTFTSISILIIEDEPLIALDLEDTLFRAGYTETSLCTSCPEAMASLSRRTPSVALLDVQLKDGLCIDVATELERRGVPFIVCSGSVKSGVPEIFLRAHWVSKPCVETELLAAIRNIMDGRSSATKNHKPKRLPNGLSPRGDFEQSKAMTMSNID